MNKLWYGLGLLSIASAPVFSWNYEVAPYLWASGLDGDQQIGTHRFHVRETFPELFRELDFGAMLWLAASQNNFGVFFNGIYSQVSDHVEKDRLDIKMSSVLTIDSVGASYKLSPLADKRFSLEPYIGARYTLNHNKVSIDRLPLNQRTDWVDGIIGSRVNYNLSSSFNIEGAVDYGQGSKSNSYNLSALLGYQSATHFKNTRFYLGYRWLHQNYHQGEGIHYYLWDMDLFGPVAGALFRF